MKLFFVALSFVVSSNAFAAVTFRCVNKSEIKGLMVVTLLAKTARIGAGDNVCAAKYIPYNPNSPKYEGWIRIAPKDAKGCPEVSAVLEGKAGGEGPAIHWVSISKEMQNGEEGFAQLGSQNQWDPGAGATVKTNLRCYPIK